MTIFQSLSPPPPVCIYVTSLHHLHLAVRFITKVLVFQTQNVWNVSFQYEIKTFGKKIKQNCSVFLSFCLSVFLSFCLSVFLSFCLSVFLSFCLKIVQELTGLYSLIYESILEGWSRIWKRLTAVWKMCKKETFFQIIIQNRLINGLGIPGLDVLNCFPILT